MPLDPIATLVLNELHRRGMTIGELSRRAGVGRYALGRWLSGSRTIRVSHAAAVMQILGLVVVAERDFRGQAHNHHTQPPHCSRPA